MGGDPIEPQLVHVEPVTVAVVHGEVRMEQIREFFDSSFSMIARVLAEQGVEPAGPAFARYNGAPTDVADLEVGFPTATEVVPDDGVAVGSLPGGRVARTVHAGGYDGLGNAWERLAAWLDDQGLPHAGPFWEVYTTEPTPQMDPSDLRTQLNWWVGD